jgi:serine/threonine protein kinase
VAYKQVAKRDLPDLKQTKEISIIRARPHANIVKIFAGFFAGRENPWDERGIDVEEDLHMLFEHTDRGNMKTWLELTAAPRHLESTAARRSHIQETIESLVEAVMCIHHDLKPANILLFLTPSPLWKICDFGMANLKHGDKSETSHHDGKGIGTYMYQPPEYFQPGQASGHGRPFDIWSLGCIILELLTVWHFGWARAPAAGIEALRDGLAKNTELAVAHRMKTNQSATADASFHNNFNVVKQWIVRLREEGAQDTVFIKILDLVSEMLVEDKNKRIFIWEVHMDLYEMANEQTKFKLTEADLQDYYRNHVVQPSRKSLAAISNNHNPLTRAKKLKKGWQVEVLGNSKNKWHDGEPEQTEELKIKRHSTGINYSTLKDCPQTHEFDRTDFYGRHDIDLKISEGFRELNCVGLYGLSGIGYRTST